MEVQGRMSGRTIRNNLCFFEAMRIRDQLAEATSRSVVAIRRFNVVAGRSRWARNQRFLLPPEWGSCCKARAPEQDDELAK